MTETETADTEPEIPPEYGTFSNRMMATIIDLGVLYMIALPIVDLIMMQLFGQMDIGPLMNALNSPELRNDPPKFIVTFFRVLHEQHAIERMVVSNLLQVMFLAVYILPFWFGFSATPGKMLFRLEIRDVKTAVLMTRKQAVARFLGYIVSALPFSLGFVWVLFNRKRRGFHDLIAGTVVVVRPKSARAQAEAN